MVGEMTYDVLGAGALDYFPCRYGKSKLIFRGPRRDLDNPFVAFLGGTETYGKFVPQPFATEVEDRLGIACANFGVPNAGVDAFVHDPEVQGAAGRARVTVVQVVGAQNMSNRFYTVHARRNDRFLAASPLLKTIYSDVDFADLNFTRHMLTTLQKVSPERFATVRQELQTAWVARMKMLLKGITGKVVLLWFSNREPLTDAQARAQRDCLGDDPLFVTREMLDEVAAEATGLVEVVTSPEARTAGTEGMVFSEMEAPAAAQMKGPRAHAEAADALVQALREMI
jgi:hypothetical protein